MDAVTALPPGPKLPRWIQTLGFMFFNRRWVDWAHRRYGDAVTFRSLFDSCFVMVFSPELVKQVFRAPPDRLRAGEANALLGPIVGERSVLLLDGREHMRQRKLLLPPFHGERMRAYQEVMVEATDRVVDSWRAGQTVTLLPAMQELTLEVIERTVFGVADAAPARGADAARAGAAGPGELTRPGADAGADRRPPRRRAPARTSRAPGASWTSCCSRRSRVGARWPTWSSARTCCRCCCARATRTGEPMTDGELRDELLTLLVAGHETTATALAWAFELLMRNPGVATRTDADLDAVVKETLRHPAGDQRRGARDPRGAVRAGRLHAAGGDGDQPVDRRHPPARRPLPAAGRLRPRRATAATTRPTPTPGCRSAAARAAAWGPASPRSRCAP